MVGARLLKSMGQYDLINSTTLTALGRNSVAIVPALTRKLPSDEIDPELQVSGELPLGGVADDPTMLGAELQQC